MSENEKKVIIDQMDCLSVQMRELLFRLAKGSLLNERVGVDQLKSLLDLMIFMKKLPKTLEDYFRENKNPGIHVDNVKSCIDEIEVRLMRMMSPAALTDDGIMSFQLFRATELIEYVHRAVQLLTTEDEKEDSHDEGTETQVDGQNQQSH